MNDLIYLIPIGIILTIIVHVFSKSVTDSLYCGDEKSPSSIQN